MHSKKAITLIGSGLIIASQLGYTMGPHISWVLVCRLLHGFGWALYTTSTAVIAGISVPPNRLSEGMGVFGMGQVVTMAIAPAAGLFLSDRYGYLIIFIICVGLSVISVGLILLLKNLPVDVNNKERNTSFQFFSVSAIGPAAISFCIGLIYSAINSFIVLYGDSLGLEQTGIFFTVTAIALLISRVLGGKLGDKTGWNSMVLSGLFSVCICIFLLGFTKSTIGILAAGLFWGLGFGFVLPNLQSFVLRINTNCKGVSMSTLSIGSDLGVGLGAGLSGIFVSIFGFAVMYRLCMGPLIIAVACTLTVHLKYDVRFRRGR